MCLCRSREQEGECAHDAQVRRQLKTLYVTGQEGLTERQAAEAIIQEARKLIEVSQLKIHKQ